MLTPVDFPPTAAQKESRAEKMAKPGKPFSQAERVRDAKARDTRFSKVEQCVGLCGDYAEAARVLALSAMDAATPREGAVRALALLLRNWERLLAEVPVTGGGGANPHSWLKSRERAREARRQERRM